MLEDEPTRRFRRLLLRHEGIRLKPYKDSVGKLTIGIGRNLDDIGISEMEALYLLSNDIRRVSKQAQDAFPWFKSISVTRQDVVLSMIFNLGLAGFSKFKMLIQAIAVQDYERAAKEMIQSKWSQQVGNRAKELAQMMRTGVYIDMGETNDGKLQL